MLSSSKMLSKLPLKILRTVGQCRPGGVQGLELCTLVAVKHADSATLENTKLLHF